MVKTKTKWAIDIETLLQDLGIKKSDLAIILGEDRFFISHILSGSKSITPERDYNFNCLSSFLKMVIHRDGTFKKSVKESPKESVERRKEYSKKLNEEFHTYLKTTEEKDDLDAAKTITR
jgi:hypothetical protein